MKRLAPAGLLILLLYHTFGLSITTLFFENGYLTATQSDLQAESVVMKMYLPELPYAENFETPEKVEGLIRQKDQFYNPTHVSHEGDTLYVTLTSNTAARERFFELANAMEQISKPDQPDSKGPYGKLLKLMSSVLQNYLPAGNQFKFDHATFYSTITQTAVPAATTHYSAATLLMHSPPPEHC